MNPPKGQQRHKAATPKKVNNISSTFLPQAIAYINSIPEGFTNVQTLLDRYRFSKHELWLFILDNTDNFYLEEHNRNKSSKDVNGKENIWIRTELRLCNSHCRKDQKCTGILCGQLHLCRTFLLLGDMCCPFYKSGKKCTFGHNLGNRHNKALLLEHNLNSLIESELRTLLRRRHCRSMSTMPQICIYYNNEKGRGCSNKNCRALHLCLDYIRGRCHERCSKNHLLSTNQVSFALDLFAIDKSWLDCDILEDLRVIMEKRTGKRSERVGDDDDDSETELKGTGKRSERVGDDDDDSETELKAAAKAKFDSDNHMNRSSCCAHCVEAMKKMAEKIQILEDELIKLKTSTSTAISMMRNDRNKDVHSLSQEQRKLMKDKLYPLVEKLQPKYADKIVERLLQMNVTELLPIVQSPDDLGMMVLKIFAEIQSKNFEPHHF